MLIFLQIWVTFISFGLGLTIYGPVAIFGVVAMETAPHGIAGTAHAVAGLFANGKELDFRHQLFTYINSHVSIGKM